MTQLEKVILAARAYREALDAESAAQALLRESTEHAAAAQHRVAVALAQLDQAAREKP